VVLLQRQAYHKTLRSGCPLDATGTAPQTNGCHYPTTTTWTAGTHYGNSANNSLWFRTTDNTTNEPGLAGVYANNRPLYYLPSEQGGEKLIGPPTPEITGVQSLNSPANNPASGYTVCTNQNNNNGSSRRPLINGLGTIELNDCPAFSPNRAARQGF